MSEATKKGYHKGCFGRQDKWDSEKARFDAIWKAKKRAMAKKSAATRKRNKAARAAAMEIQR